MSIMPHSAPHPLIGALLGENIPEAARGLSIGILRERCVAIILRITGYGNVSSKKLPNISRGVVTDQYFKASIHPHDTIDAEVGD